MLVRRQHRSLIQSVWLVHALAGSDRGHHCRDCGSRMFVMPDSGRCPVCQARRRLYDECIEEILSDRSDGAL
jgi:rubrerythrin